MDELVAPAYPCVQRVSFLMATAAQRAEYGTVYPGELEHTSMFDTGTISKEEAGFSPMFESSIEECRELG
jgi:hypothetical protein